MNIMIINHYAGSPAMGMEYRPYYMAQEWIKMGHRVVILAGDYSHLRISNHRVKKNFVEEEIDGITYCWIRTVEYNTNGVKRALTMGQFVGKILFNAKWIVDKYQPEIIITSSTYPLDTYAGQKIKNIMHQKYGRSILIHEIHDMWPVAPMELGGMSKINPFAVIMQISENSFCRNADRIVSLLPAAKGYLIEHGMSPEKFYTVPNGIPLDEWNTKEQLPPLYQNLIDRWKKEHKFIICFFGSHTKSYALQYLIDAIKRIENKNIVVLFVGDGMNKTELIEQAKGWEEQIKFLPPIKKIYIPSLLDKIDSIYIGAVNNKMLKFGICMNKLFDAMMSGKPILYAVDAPNNYIKEFRCGINIIPENTESLIEGIQKLLFMSEFERKKMGIRGRDAVMRNFNYHILALKFLQIMK